MWVLFDSIICLNSTRLHGYRCCPIILLSGFSNFLFFSTAIICGLIKLKEDHAVLLEESTDVNISCSHDYKILIASIRDCMDGQMSTALVKMKKIDGAGTVEQSSSKNVEELFKEVDNFTPQDMFNELLLYYLESSTTNLWWPGWLCSDILHWSNEVSINKFRWNRSKRHRTSHQGHWQTAGEIGNFLQNITWAYEKRRKEWKKHKMGVFNKFEIELALLPIGVN